MKISKVRQLTVEERFLYWIKERWDIQKKKKSGKPKPWSDDEIFQTYKFCNVLRKEDRVSQWLIKNWYEPNKDHPNIITAATLARQLNNTESLEEVGFPDVWRPKSVQKVLEARFKRGLKNFSAAYMITGSLGGTKIDQVVNKVVTPVHTAVRKGSLEVSNSLVSLADSLLPFAGISTFIAGQVAADVKLATTRSWHDAKTWAPVGPGSKRGINRLLNREPKASLSSDRFQKQFKSVANLVKKELPSIYRQCDGIDIQNCLCEFQKYERTLWGQGRPKQKYPGV